MGAESDVRRHRSAVLDLQKKIGQESTKVATARKKAASALQSAQRATSASTQTSRYREAERENEKANKAEAERAKLEGQLAARNKQLYDAEAKLIKEQAATQQRNLRQLDDAIRRSERQFRPTRPAIRPAPPLNTRLSATAPDCDLFVSHASEDKEEIARPLADALIQAGLNVWFDELTLQVGDSLRRKIDDGLARSRFGVVILSPHFFEKEWTQIELDGLTAKATTTGETVILPIWHHLSKDDVLARSPSLAGVKALNTALMTIDEIAEALVVRVQA